MNDPKSKSLTVPAAMVTLLLITVVFYGSVRPESGNRKSPSATESSFREDEETPLEQNENTSTVPTESPTAMPAALPPEVPVSPVSVITNSVGMQLIRIPAGEFWMGSATNESGRWDDEYRHRVAITKSFYMAVHEVTIGQFRQFVNATAHKTEPETDRTGGFGFNVNQRPIRGRYDRVFSWKSAGYSQTDQHPVANLTWNDANAFVEWLSREEGVRYRLPTEAEWEYACRAGTDTAFVSGSNADEITKFGNVADQSLRAAGVDSQSDPGFAFAAGDDGYVFTAPVGSFRKNAFGLCDMTGNVCEWCSDWFHENYYLNSPATDPQGPEKGVFRVFRGGGWQAWERHFRCANRARYGPDFRADFIGLRVVREDAPAVAETSELPQKPVATSDGSQGLPNSVGNLVTDSGPKPMTQSEVGPVQLQGRLADPVVIGLANPYRRFAVGGSGRYFILHQPENSKLVVVDVLRQGIVHELTDVLDDVLFTAGADALFVARPAQGTLERIGLESFRREKISSLPVDSPPYALKMGSNAVSPLFLACDNDACLIDGRTLERIGDSIGARGRYGYEFQLSADGQTALGIVTGLSPVSWDRMIVGQPETQSVGSTSNYSRYWSGPTADGSLILIEAQECDRNLRRISMKLFEQDRLLPTVDPRFYLAVRFGTENVQCQICNVADRRTIFTIQDFEDMWLPVDDKRPELLRKRLDEDRDCSFWFLPQLKSFVTLNWDRQQISIYPFDLEETLRQKGAPWLYVTSIPPLQATRGADLFHQFQSFSSSDHVEYHLESPVEGLSLTSQGELHWKVPAEFEQDSVRMLIRAATADKESFVQFEVFVQSPSQKEAEPAKK